MTTIQYFQPSPDAEAALPSLPENTSVPSRRRRLRLYLVGSREDTQAAIDHFHLHRCIDRVQWNLNAIDIPENGLIIRPDPEDVLRYLQRRPFR